MLPIGVVLPTRNSMALLPRHLETMRHWLDLVEEVVIVDSESTDGTRECLKRELTGPRVRFFEHPRGLYQSWNFGIRQITSRYTYISTVGDEMTREGLQHLTEVAEHFRCDVVISKPDFVDEANRPVSPPKWPIDHIIGQLQIEQPVCLEGWLIALLAFVNSAEAILGSSASNLYLTSCLQKRPFPTEFGTVGDGAWGLKNAMEIRLGVTPKRLSFFREHAKSYSLSEYAIDDLIDRLRRLAIQSLRNGLNDSPQLKREAEELKIDALIQCVEERHRWQQKLTQHRRRLWPWIFHPGAWNARARRNELRRESDLLLKESLLRARALRPPQS